MCVCVCVFVCVCVSGLSVFVCHSVQVSLNEVGFCQFRVHLGKAYPEKQSAFCGIFAFLSCLFCLLFAPNPLSLSLSACLPYLLCIYPWYFYASPFLLLWRLLFGDLQYKTRPNRPNLTPLGSQPSIPPLFFPLQSFMPTSWQPPSSPFFLCIPSRRCSTNP